MKSPIDCTDCQTPLGEPVESGQYQDVYHCPECQLVHYVGTACASPAEHKRARRESSKPSPRKRTGKRSR